MTISRDTYSDANHYRRVRFHEDRSLLDCELNEMQAEIAATIASIGNALMPDGLIVSGLVPFVSSNMISITTGYIYINGSVEYVAAADLTFDAGKTTGVDHVYAELMRYAYGLSQDALLGDPRTGLATAEREKWVVTLKATDTTNDAYPALGLNPRHVIPIFDFDRATGVVTRTAGYLHDSPGPIGRTVPNSGRFSTILAGDSTIAGKLVAVSLEVGVSEETNGILTVFGDDETEAGRLELHAGGTATGISAWSLQANATGVLQVNDGTDNVLSVDGTNNRLGVNVAEPTEAVDVSGNLKISGSLLAYSITGVTGTGTPTGGSDGDIRIQADGIYQKRSGTWTLITT